jgi:hypothetical protein
VPVIKVWCLPSGQSEEDLKHLHQEIVKAVLSVTELGLHDQSDMTCLFPPDLMKYGLGEEIIIEIGGLFEKPERTQEVRQRLAENVGKAVKDLYPKAKVECFISSFDPRQGFWTSESEVQKKDEPECKVHGSIEHMQSATGKCPGCGKP